MVKKVDKPQLPADPETEQKRALRSLSLSRSLLRRSRAAPSAPLEPSKSVQKLEGRDIVKRGQRKSRYLFSFPGLLAPLSGGRIGELADLGTRNPVLYLDFPKGRVKLFGTHVYPKNKYLTLQLTRSAKGVMCEDCFESLIVFPEAWWIGSKEENPEEHQLEFPKDLNEDKNADYDFKGGAGATSEEASGAKKPTKEYKEPLSPDTELELEHIDEDAHPSTRIDVENVMNVTPARQSARMAGKSLNYAESSGSDSVSSDAEVPEMTADQAIIRSDDAPRRSLFGETEASSPTTSTFLAPVSETVDIKKQEQSSSVKKSQGPSNKKGTLIQANLSTLFEKAEEKLKCVKDSGVSKASGARRKRLDSKKITDQVHVEVSKKRGGTSGGKRSGSRTVSVKKKKKQVLDDDLEDISSDSQDDSDDDWSG